MVSVNFVGRYSPVATFANRGGLTTGYSAMYRNPYSAADFLQSGFSSYGAPSKAANLNYAPGIMRALRRTYGPELNMLLHAYGRLDAALMALEAELALNQLAWRWIIDGATPDRDRKRDSQVMMNGAMRIGPSGNPEIFSYLRTSASQPAYTPASFVTTAIDARVWLGIVQLGGIWQSHFPDRTVVNQTAGVQRVNWRFDIPPAGQPFNLPVSIPIELAAPKQSPWQDTDQARRSRLEINMVPQSWPFVLDVGRSAAGGMMVNRPPPKGVREKKQSSKKLVGMLYAVESGGDLLELLYAYYQSAVETAKKNGDPWKSWSSASWGERMSMLQYGISHGFDPATLNDGILKWGLGEMVGRYLPGYDSFRHYYIDSSTPRITVI